MNTYLIAHLSDYNGASAKKLCFAKYLRESEKE